MLPMLGLSDDFFSYTVTRSLRSLWRCVNSTYLWVSLVYLVQCILVVDTNLNAPDIDDRIVGNNHIMLRLARLFISCMFILTWKDGRHWLDPVLLPDYVDLFASVWMLFAAAMYVNVASSETMEGIVVVRRVEVASWFLEIVASIGWFYSWYVVHREEYESKPEPTPNRGWTLDDPDMLVNFTNIATACTFYMYSYNLSITPDASDVRDYSELHHIGDDLLIFNAWLYVIAAMRDCDVFWFMPHWGTVLSIEEIRNGKHLAAGELFHTTSSIALRNLPMRIHAPASKCDGDDENAVEMTPLMTSDPRSP